MRNQSSTCHTISSPHRPLVFGSLRVLTLLSAAAALAVFAPATASAQDVIVDNFDDNNALAENWAGEWSGPTASQPLTNRGLAFRSTANAGGFSSPVSTSDKATSWVADGNGGYAVRYGNAGITAPSNSTLAQRHHGVNMAVGKLGNSLGNYPNFDNLYANNRRYLRFTAWRDTTPAAPSPAFFVAGAASPPSSNSTFPDMSIGPWTSNGGSLQGYALSTSKQVFTLDLWDGNRFKADPVYQANVKTFFASGTTSGSINRAKMMTLNFGYYRSGTTVTTAMDPVQFYIDDIILMSRPAGYDTTPTATIISESGPSSQTTAGVALAAIPSHPVVLNVASSNPSVFTISTTTLTFTPANYNVPQVIDIQAVDDGIPNHVSRTANLVFTKGTTPDLLYASGSVATPTAIAYTINPVASASATVTTSSTSMEELGAGSSTTFNVVLDSIPTQPVTVNLSSSDTGAMTVGSPTLLFDSSNWNIAQTVTLNGVDDNVTAGGNRIANVQFGFTTTCPFYGAASAPNDLPFEIINNGLPVSMSHMSIE